VKIRAILEEKKPVFSFEFFPPKSPQAEARLMETLWDLSRLGPDFVSVTYGAGGSTRESTLQLVSRIKNDLALEAMAHLTCVGAARDELAETVRRLQAAGIENVLALRGDPPQGEETFRPAPGGFAHASELAAFLKEKGDFCLGGACYPEGHPEASGLEEDIRHLKTKVEAGVEFLVTQLFFDNADYFSFLEKIRSAGIGVPVIPGIMPVTSYRQVKRFTEMCGAHIPAELEGRLRAAGDDPLKVPTIGVEWAVAQCRELLDRGAPGIHFFTLNHSPATRAVFEAIRRA